MRKEQSTKWVRISLQGGLIVCLALAFLEVFLRLTMPLHLTGYIGAYQYDEELGVVPQKNISHIKLTDYRQEFVTNTLGTVNYEDTFDPYKYRIYVIGDSYTQGTGNPSDTSYPFQLSLLLNRDEQGLFQANAGVVNLGLAAYGLKQEILSMSRYVKILGAPHVILQLGAHNDVNDDFLFRSGYRHGHLVAGNPKYAPFSEFLAWISNSMEILKRVKVLLSRKSMYKVTKSKSETSFKQQTLKTQAARLEKDYEELKKTAHSFGARLIISWADCSSSYDWLKSWAKKHQVGFADWCPVMLSYKKGVPRLPLHNEHSGGHYRVWVNTLIADAFARELEQGQYLSGIQ